MPHRNWFFFKFFFIILKLAEFLKFKPSEWNSNRSYTEGVNKIKKIKVLNDCAERGVKLIQDFTNCLTADEEQLQYILQIAKEYKKIPDCKKSTLIKEKKNCKKFYNLTFTVKKFM